MEPYVASDCLLTKYARGPRLFTLIIQESFECKTNLSLTEGEDRTGEYSP